MEICVERGSDRTRLAFVAHFADDTHGLQFYSDSKNSPDLFVNMAKESSKAAALGLRAGDRIVSINGQIPTEPINGKILEDSWMNFFLAQCAALPGSECDVSRAGSVPRPQVLRDRRQSSRTHAQP